MTLKQIRVKAKDAGVKNITKYPKETLIKTIQQTEGNIPCFRGIMGCGETGCAWRTDCQN